jgi:tetratricopeptide (TPR) repeat protein
MNKFIFFTLLTLVLIACNSKEEKQVAEKPTKEVLKSKIDEMDDSLQVLYQEIMKDPTKKIPSLAIYNTINKYKDFYENYPKDPFAPVCLDKIQQLYLQEKVYVKSLEFTDILLKEYPAYKDKALVLLNAGSTCEILNDRKKMKKYYTQLLEEYPKIDKDTKEMVEFRLKHIDLTFDQLIELQSKELSKK